MNNECRYSINSIWEIIHKLIQGQVPLIEIKKYLYNIEGGELFIEKYLCSTNVIAKTLPCNECDEYCDNKKIIKKLSNNCLVQICPNHPTNCQDISYDDISLFHTGKVFFTALAQQMHLENIPKIFPMQNLIYIGTWNTINFFGKVYLANTQIPSFLEQEISSLLLNIKKNSTEEQVAIISPFKHNILSNLEDKMRKYAGKIFPIDELFDVNQSGDLLFKDEARNYFSTVDMTRKINQRVPFIQYKETSDKPFWYINGVPSSFKRTSKSKHFKFLNLLATQYNAGGTCWVAHEIIMNELKLSAEQYWGDAKNSNPGRAQRIASDIRREVGIEIDYSKKEGFKITGGVKSQNMS